MNLKSINTYRGIPVEELSKKELINAYKKIWESYQRTVDESVYFFELYSRSFKSRNRSSYVILILCVIIMLLTFVLLR